MNAASSDAWMPPALRKLAGRALEAALNHALARRLEKRAVTVAADLEEAFARRLGSVAGVPRAGAVRKDRADARGPVAHPGEGSAVWLRDEVHAALAPGALRQRGARLESRVRQLSRHVRDDGA